MNRYLWALALGLLSGIAGCGQQAERGRVAAEARLQQADLVRQEEEARMAPIRKLEAEVAALYKRQVKYVDKVGTQDFYGGESMIADDGTPTIYLNPFNPHRLATMAHELWHLLLKAKGYPSFTLHIDAALDNEVVFNTHSAVKEYALHYLFFPEIERLGLDPRANVTSWMKNVCDNGKVAGLAPKMLRVVTYLRALLESNDQQIVARMRAAYESNAWGHEVELATRAWQTIRNGDLRTPQGYIAICRTVVNDLFRGVCFFSEPQTTSVRKGNVEERFVEYWIERR